MLKGHWYQYTTPNPRTDYDLLPDVIVDRGRWKLVGVGMYTRQRRYVGYWDRHNMPINLVRKIEKHVAYYEGKPPANLRK